nr:MAG TPA: hypothetical protein [Bacteriophage sp.]DAY11669.1 MAG TPA: hypothetical protein [Bacteriophage sp.]
MYFFTRRNSTFGNCTVFHWLRNWRTLKLTLN